MKEWLIRLTDEKDLFYDSTERLYRVRMHCPQCGKDSGCRCFLKLEKAEDFMTDGQDFTCSSKCSLMCLVDYQGRDEIADSMKEMGFQTWSGFFYASFKDKLLCNNITWRIKSILFRKLGRISGKDAYEVYCFIDPDFDSVEGEAC